MLRSMFSGVSGLRAHMDKMDVISNNIANVNTTGYKGSRATFKTMLSQTMQGASAPQDGRGGTNAQQIGLGVSMGSIDKNMGQGNLQSTGRNTDLAIEGNGLFVVSSGSEDYYTRAGSTDFDRDGYLVNTSNGYRMQGWVADADGNIDTNGALEDVSLKQSMNAEPTTFIDYDGNLSADANEGENWNTAISVYDSKGSLYNVGLEFKKGADDNTWGYNITSLVDPAGVDYIDNPDSPDVDLTDGDIIFENNGTVKSVAGIPATELEDDGHPILGFNPEGSDPVEIELDFSSVTQFAGQYNADIDTLNGYTAGAIQSFDIDNSGTITGYYDNGQRQTLGRVGVASFNNPGGLSEVGDTLYRESNNSGIANIGGPGSGGRGSLSAGTLEMSNVDMASEFTEMITTQRGFQGNSRTISTSDELLQELVNLKR